MRIDNFTHVCGKDRFALTIQIEPKDLRPLQQQAYKDAISVQELVRKWLADSMNDLVIFSKGA